MFDFKFPGRQAGSIWCDLKTERKTKYWYTSLTIDGKQRRLGLHRAVYSIHHDVQLTDEDQIDHEDGDGLNNSPSNIRLATHQQNRFNNAMRSDNKSGYTGVRLLPCGKYQATMMIGKKIHSLGCFNTAEEASKEYQLRARLTRGEFHTKRK
jgi:hypothetical protein